MKVLLLRDVYKLGRAGDVKRVADGYGRNFLLPQGLAVLATPGALKQVERIKEAATEQRALLNKEMDAVAKRLEGVVLTFVARASETGKLYGSITTQMISEAIQKKVGVEVARRQIDSQPLRNLGDYKVGIRLTVDLIPTISVVIHREGEAPVIQEAQLASEAPVEAEVPVEAELTEEVTPEEAGE